MSVITDEYKREIQKIKMQLSDQIEENVRLKGFKQMVLEKPDDFEDKRTYKSLKEHGNDMSYENEVGLLEENKKLKKRAEEAEGENTIIKGIGQNSPEMKALQARVKRLDDSLANALEINETHQRYNGTLQVRVKDLENDNKLLSKQISDYIKKHEDKFRTAGI